MAWLRRRALLEGCGYLLLQLDPKLLRNAFGKFMTGAGTCANCLENTFASQPGATECVPCNTEAGETSPPGASFCAQAELDCPDGTYKDSTKTVCLACPKKGAICTENEIELFDDWWFDADQLALEKKEISLSTEVFPCLNPLACVTDVNNVSVSCSTGYMGVLCGACDLKGKATCAAGSSVASASRSRTTCLCLRLGCGWCCYILSTSSRSRISRAPRATSARS